MAFNIFIIKQSFEKKNNQKLLVLNHRYSCIFQILLLYFLSSFQDVCTSMENGLILPHHDIHISLMHQLYFLLFFFGAANAQ